MAKLRLDLKPFKKLIRKLRGTPVPDTVRNQWAVRYSAFVRRRFKNQGDGEWKSLAPSTIKKRRKKGVGAKILRDTGVLFRALSIGASGNLVQPLKDGVRFGFADTPHKGTKKTIREIAIIHELGKGRNPKRTILVEPTPKLIRSMASDLRRSIQGRGVRHA